jgi:small-conductance mechanosensitive channel
MEGMKARLWIPLVVLLLLVGAVGVGLHWSADTGTALPGMPQHARRAAKAKTKGKEKGRSAPRPGASAADAQDLEVDESPLQIARGLRPIATTEGDQAFAKQAERLANHEVDLAFADALRQFSSQPPQLTPEQQELVDLKEQAGAAVAADKKRVAELTRQLAKAADAAREALEDQLDVAKAQMELDQDEFDVAGDDLERAGGDPQARLGRLRAAHEAADKESSVHALPVLEAVSHATLFSEVREWLQLRRKVTQLDEVERQANEKAGQLAAHRDARLKLSGQNLERREEAKQNAAEVAQGKAPKGSAKATLQNLRQYMDNQRILADLGKRVQDLQDLAALYGAWGDLAENQTRAALHGTLTRTLWILLIVLVVVVAGHFLSHRTGDLDTDQRRGAGGLIAKVALQIVGAIAILLIILGVPAQTTTILGLAGAGLTVALKDFILAFLGWFILVGRNGLRVGDWVEIKGVSGEVVEIGLLRTVLLETGAWSDASHPTGRRVAFVNSFAIEGHYFNFSTSAQWMWDELRAVIPTGQDPAPVLEGIQTLVAAQTETNAKQAEADWKGATKRYRVQAFSTVPALHVLPVAGGIEVRVRYITRAHESDASRQRLNQAVVELMRGKGSGS